MFHIIVNPVAGRGCALKRLSYLTKLFENKGVGYKVFETKAPMDGYEIAKRLCRENSSGIIGVGGDGTIQEIAAGMMEACKGKPYIPVPLAILPCGSGNDFAITIGRSKLGFMRKYHSIKDAGAAKTVFNAVTGGRKHRVDLIKADSMAFLNIGNMGLDAKIATNALQLKKRFGHYAYIAAVYKSITQHENLPLTIKVDGEVLKGKYTLVAICNGQYYGGGLKIAPKACVDDGKITACLVESMSRSKAMLLFPTILLTLHTHLKEVRYLKCDSLTVTFEEGETLCLDGNLYKKSGNVTFEVLPRALSIFV